MMVLPGATGANSNTVKNLVEKDILRFWLIKKRTSRLDVQWNGFDVKYVKI